MRRTTAADDDPTEQPNSARLQSDGGTDTDAGGDADALNWFRRNPDRIDEFIEAHPDSVAAESARRVHAFLARDANDGHFEYGAYADVSALFWDREDAATAAEDVRDGVTAWNHKSDRGDGRSAGGGR